MSKEKFLGKGWKDVTRKDEVSQTFQRGDVTVTTCQGSRDFVQGIGTNDAGKPTSVYTETKTDQGMMNNAINSVGRKGHVVFQRKKK